jgi:hypothetical protein
MPLNILNPLRNAVIFSLSGSMLPLWSVAVPSVQWMATDTTSLFTCLVSRVYWRYYLWWWYTYIAPSKCEGQARNCWRWKNECHMVFSNFY